jgi:hypothetical protein
MFAGNNGFSGAMQEMAADYLINRFVPGGLNSELTKDFIFSSVLNKFNM